MRYVRDSDRIMFLDGDLIRDEKGEVVPFSSIQHYRVISPILWQEIDMLLNEAELKCR